MIEATTPRGMGGAVVGEAVKALDAWERGINLDEWSAAARSRDFRGRGAVANVVYSYFRHKGLVDAVLTHLCPRGVKPAVGRLLAVAITQTRYQRGLHANIAANLAVEHAKRHHGGKIGGFVNAVLRNASRLDWDKFAAELPEHARLNLPELVCGRWRRCFGESETCRLAALAAEPPPLFMRPGRNPNPDEAAQFQLAAVRLPTWADGVDFFACGSPDGIFSSPLGKHPGTYFQDPAAAAFASSLRGLEPKLILDVCAAPGGKTLLLAAIFPAATIVAGDVSLERQHLTSANLAAAAAAQCHPLVASGTRGLPFRDGLFDLVLVDAPCSNTGVFRRRPDVLWRFSQNRLEELLGKQRKLLEESWRTLASGGKLAYSTCSVEPEENSAMVAAFAAKHPEAAIEMELSILPDTNHDGAYHALITKNQL